MPEKKVTLIKIVKALTGILLTALSLAASATGMYGQQVSQRSQGRLSRIRFAQALARNEPAQREEYLYQSRSACVSMDNPSSHYRAFPYSLLTKTSLGTYEHPVFADSRKILLYLVSDYLNLYGVSSLL